jgi:replication initiation protein RepC
VFGAGKPTGWRKATPGLGLAERHAQIGEGESIPKTRAFVAVKRVGSHIGLKAGDMMLLDKLGAFTQAQDWDAGRRPIVWASNAYLMEQTGFSLSALKRHARRLAEAGVIAFRDSPNGKRWGRRDAEGMIVEAYGFDLAPLAARTEEFEQLLEELQAERALCLYLKRQITVSRRMIRARLEAAFSGALRGPWAEIQTLFEDLLSKLPRRSVASGMLDRLLSAFQVLQSRVEGAYLEAVTPDEGVENPGKTPVSETKNTQEMTPSEVISEPHIPITNQLDPVIRNSSEVEEAAAVPPDFPSDAAAVPPDFPSDAAAVPPDFPSDAPADTALDEWVTEVRKIRIGLDLPTLMQACPEFAVWVRDMAGFVKDWGDLHRVAGQLRPMIGISDHAWNVAQDRLGKQVATAALALVFEKHSAGEVASPGGYLRGMVEKAGAGELHLERSIYGRLSGQAA